MENSLVYAVNVRQVMHSARRVALPFASRRSAFAAYTITIQPLLDRSLFVHRSHLLFLFFAFELFRLFFAEVPDREAKPHQNR